MVIGALAAVTILVGIAGIGVAAMLTVESVPEFPTSVPEGGAAVRKP